MRLLMDGFSVTREDTTQPRAASSPSTRGANGSSLDGEGIQAWLEWVGGDEVARAV